MSILRIIVIIRMHRVFRIGDIENFDDRHQLFAVQLILTEEEDSDWRQLTDRIEKDIGDCTAGRMLLRLGQFSKAEELYLALLKQIQNGHDQWLYYNHLGKIKSQQGDYQGTL